MATMTTELVIKLISCELCENICGRGVCLPCCSVQACRGCATKKVLSTKKCWNCNENVRTEEFVNDMDLRNAVDELKENKACSLKTKLRLMARANACRLTDQFSSKRNSVELPHRQDILEDKPNDKVTENETTNRIPTSFAYKTESDSCTSDKSRTLKKSGLRPIVIDGCNVAFEHGNNEDLSVKGIELIVEYFLNRGHDTVVAFLPEDRFDEVYDPVECFILNSLKKKGQLVCPPSNTYDDRMILDYATNNSAIVVSRDKFRDIYQDTPSYRQVIEHSTLVPTFIADSVYFPEDPQGRGGKSLDELLRF